jgi:hypothetical protein
MCLYTKIKIKCTIEGRKKKMFSGNCVTFPLDHESTTSALEAAFLPNDIQDVFKHLTVEYYGKYNRRKLVRSRAFMELTRVRREKVLTVLQALKEVNPEYRNTVQAINYDDLDAPSMLPNDGVPPSFWDISFHVHGSGKGKGDDGDGTAVSGEDGDDEESSSGEYDEDVNTGVSVCVCLLATSFFFLSC